MNILQHLFDEILAKHSPKRTKLDHLKKLSGSIPPNTPSKYPHFSKKYLEPPPPLPHSPK